MPDTEDFFSIKQASGPSKEEVDVRRKEKKEKMDNWVEARLASFEAAPAAAVAAPAPAAPVAVAAEESLP